MDGWDEYRRYRFFEETFDKLQATFETCQEKYGEMQGDLIKSLRRTIYSIDSVDEFIAGLYSPERIASFHDAQFFKSTDRLPLFFIIYFNDFSMRRKIAA